MMVEEDGQLKRLGKKHFYEIFKDDGKTNISDQLKVIKLFHYLILMEYVNVFTSEVTLAEVEGGLKSL